MKTPSVAILMTMLSLAAAAHLVAGADVDVIRLPGDGSDGLDAGQPGAAEEKTRPWKCCDVTVCTRSYPPVCFCQDKVEQCDEACASCVEASESEPSRRVCKDWYRGDPGPRCTSTKEGGGGDEEGAPAAEAREERKEEDEEDAKDRGGDVVETRPWACCNNTLCTKSYPPTCSCLDVVEVCAGACQRCEPSGLDPLRRVCNDKYHGDPGPKCAKDDGDDDDDVPSGASRPVAAAARLLFAFVALLFIQSR